MNFYKRFIGDITAKTGGLSLAQMGAYDRLLDHFYSTERPIQKDEIYSICRAMTKADRADVDKVLSRFWELTQDGYIQEKAEEVIAKARPLIEAARENGKKGGRPRTIENPEKTQRVHGDATDAVSKSDFAPQKNAREQVAPRAQENGVNEIGEANEINELGDKTKPAGLSDKTQQKPSAKASQSQSQSHSPSLRSGEVGAEALPGVSENLFRDYMAVRRDKKARTFTMTAANGLIRGAAEAGITISRALEACCEYGWIGFRPDWFADRQKRQRPTAGIPGVQSFAERDREAGMARWEQMTGRVHPDRAAGGETIDVTNQLRIEP